MKALFYDFEDIFTGDGSFLTEKAAECAERLGISGDAWAGYLAYRLLFSENVFSLAAERGRADGTLTELVRTDAEKIIGLFGERFFTESGLNEGLKDYKPGGDLKPAGERVMRLARRLVSAAKKAAHGSRVRQAAEEFTAALKEEYAAGGAGELGLSDAFRLVSDRTADGYRLTAVTNFSPKSFDSIVGCDEQKAALIENTRALIEGEGCNNALLYGNAGTGKSTSVKALIPYFAGRKLKIIEIYRHQYQTVARLMSDIENRGFSFILFLDDLSFEENETEYKYFKAILDGGLGARPRNTAVYATSNRLHIIRESFSDRSEIGRGDIHGSDTVEEKLSLSARFGLSLFYPSPDQAEYLNIVAGLAAAEGINMPADRLRLLALRWATAHNRKSGRTAEQFVRSLIVGKGV